MLDIQEIRRQLDDIEKEMMKLQKQYETTLLKNLICVH